MVPLRLAHATNHLPAHVRQEALAACGDEELKALAQLYQALLGQGANRAGGG